MIKNSVRGLTLSVNTIFINSLAIVKSEFMEKVKVRVYIWYNLLLSRIMWITKNWTFPQNSNTTEIEQNSLSLMWVECTHWHHKAFLFYLICPFHCKLKRSLFLPRPNKSQLFIRRIKLQKYVWKILLYSQTISFVCVISYLTIISFDC